MKFSQQYPKAPGLYYYRLMEDSNIHHCRVWESPSMGLVATAGDKYKSVTKFARWWSIEFLPQPE